jgi:hypothetical protein
VTLHHFVHSPGSQVPPVITQLALVAVQERVPEQVSISQVAVGTPAVVLTYPCAHTALHCLLATPFSQLIQV